MSRSYKKNPIVKDSGQSKKNQKRIASHKVRQKFKNPELDFGHGNAYKKETESYEITDCVYRWSKDDAIAYYNNPDHDWVRKKYPTLDKWLQHWKKEMLGK